ncbi:MAG: Wzz/FepE/Etk N-terminal domain-containing protein [Candidatus Electrothrix sp. GW3-4]|uniref:GumC family protein n=1 Tax=Candidatus Electrothrix sp. GW3-4 TaxID=3126740 RepID=UPI0030D00844
MELRILLKILHRRRAVLALVLISFLLLVTLITLLAPESYEATAKISVEKTDKINAVMTGLGLQGIVLDTRVDDSVSFDTDVELLMIRPLVEGLIVNMDLRDSDDEYFKVDEFLEGGLKNKIKGSPSIDIKQYNDTALVSIAASSTVPEQAAEIANRLARMYKDERIMRMKADFGEVKDNINSSLDRIRENYYRTLRDYEIFMERIGLGKISTALTNLLDQISDLEKQRSEYQRTIASLGKTIEVSKKELGKTKKLWESSHELGQNAVMTDLREKLTGLSVELAGLGITVTKNHPDHKSLTAQLDEITALLKNEPTFSISRKQFTLNPIYNSLYQSISENIIKLKGTLVLLKTVEQQLDEYKAKLLQLPALQTENTKLNMELTAQSTIYSTLLQYAMEISLAETAAVSKIRLVEPAKTPDIDEPDFPTKEVNFILGVIFGTFFAVGTALVIDYADDNVHEAQVLHHLSDKPYLGSLPYAPSLRPKTILQSSTRVTEHLRSMRDTLLFENANQQAGGLFVITSATERGGTSTVATGLAKTFAERCGETLLVDLNLRSPSLGGLTGQNKRSLVTGVAEALANNGIVTEDSFQNSSLEGLTILLAGKPSAETEKLLDTPALAILLNNLRQQFRYVIIDTPSPAFYHDAVLIAQEADAVVLVVRAAEITGAAVVHYLEKLRIIGDPIIGTVLNGEGYSLSLHRLPWITVMFAKEQLLRQYRRYKRT